MQVTLDVRTQSGRLPTKMDMQKNIDALQRAIDRKSLAMDFVLLIDAKTMLESIQKNLPNN